MIYYLKTNTEEELWQALEAAGIAVKDYDQEDELNKRPEDAEENWQPTGAFTWRFTGEALDIIGTIYVESGTLLTDDEGNEYPEMVAMEGFHANVIAREGLELPELVPPSTPYRIFGGVVNEISETITEEEVVNG